MGDVSSDAWQLGPDDGALTIHTGVAGRAARMGHRLTIAMNSWQLDVDWADGAPARVTLGVEVGSLAVVTGEGGVTPLSGPEKVVVRSNALKVLDAGKFPRIEYVAEDITAVDGGYRLAGTLTLHGVAKPVEVDVTVTEDGDNWTLAGRTEIAQTDFRLKPFSMFVGSLKVADTVTIAAEVTHSKHRG